MLAAGAAAWVAAGGSPRVPAAAGAADRQGGRRAFPFPDRPPGAVGTLACCLGGAAMTGFGGLGPVPGLLAGGLGLLALRGRRVARARVTAAAERQALIAACSALGAQLRAGRTPAAALAAGAELATGASAQALHRAAGLALLGGDVPDALAAAATGGCTGRVLGQLAACWRVSQGTGAGLAASVDQLAAALRAHERQRLAVGSQLAGARTTARLLAALPVIGLLMAAAFGADPLRVLLSTPIGLACLTVATVLDVAGVLWTDRLVSSALPGLA